MLEVVQMWDHNIRLYGEIKKLSPKNLFICSIFYFFISLNNNRLTLFHSILLQAVFIFNLIQYAPLTYDEYKYPSWADGLGWILALFPLIWIFSSSVWKITTVKGEMTLLDVSLLEQFD